MSTSTVDISQEAKEVGEAYARIQSENGYKDVTEGDRLGNLDSGVLKTKFFCQDNLDKLKGKDPSKVAIVTGFGAVNSPTAGTLSIIMKAIAMQKATGFDTEIVISNLGAFCARDRDYNNIDISAKRFQEFIRLMGFDETKGRIRTHIDREVLGIASLVNEHALTTEDFNANHGVTKAMYAKQGLLSNNLGRITSATYTATDIIKPLFKGSTVKDGPHDKENVLVLMGIDEHYFPRLANKAVDTLNKKFPGQYVNENPQVSVLFGNLIKGLYPYPKMSKSQPESSINIGDDPLVIRRKIMQDKPENQEPILDMITQASMWSPEKVKSAITAYDQRDTNPEAWKQVKEEYTQHFLDIAKKWQMAVMKYPDPKTRGAGMGAG